MSKEKAIADDEQKKVQVINEEVTKKQSDCMRDLAKAEPALKAAQEALDTLNKVSIEIMTTFASRSSTGSDFTSPSPRAVTRCRALSPHCRRSVVAALRSAVAALSQHCRCTVAALSPRCRRTVTVLRSAVAALSLHGRSAVAALSPHGHRASQRCRSTVVARSQRCRSTVAARSQHGRSAVAA